MKLEKIVIVRVLKAIVKYVIPAVLGWLEGNAHTVEDALLALLDTI